MELLTASRINRTCFFFGARLQNCKKSDFYLRHIRQSVSQSAWNDSAPTGRILMKFGV